MMTVQPAQSQTESSNDLALLRITRGIEAGAQRAILTQQRLLEERNAVALVRAQLVLVGEAPPGAVDIECWARILI